MLAALEARTTATAPQPNVQSHCDVGTLSGGRIVDVAQLQAQLCWELCAATNVCGSVGAQVAGQLRRNGALHAREGGHREPIALKMGLARGLVVENQHGVCSARTSMVTRGHRVHATFFSNWLF